MTITRRGIVYTRDADGIWRRAINGTPPRSRVRAWLERRAVEKTTETKTEGGEKWLT